jgi:AcrR family transcriptional regulator
LLRRAKTLNELRLVALEEVETRHKEDEVSVEEIIEAFTRPLLDILENDPDEWRDYMALIAQINNSTEWGGELMTRFFDPLVERFLDAIRRALPGCREEDLFWSYHFLSGALTLTFAETGRIDNLSGGLCRSSDMAAANARMARFIAAGFRELCGSSAAKTEK